MNNKNLIDDNKGLYSQKTYEYIESKRICKKKFNIFSVAAVENKANFFIGSLIFGLPLIALGIIGLFLLFFDIQLELGIFLIFMSFFGIGALGIGIKYLLHAKKIYSSGKAYLINIDIDYDSLNFDCVLCINGKIITRDAIGLRIPVNKTAPIIYSEEFDEFIFLKSKKVYNDFNDDCNDLRYEDDLVLEYCRKLHRKGRKRLESLLNADGSQKISLFKIFAADKNKIHVLPYFIINSILIIIFALGIAGLNFFLNTIIPNPIVIGLTIFCSIVLLLALIFLIIIIHDCFKIRTILNNSVLYFGTIIGIEKKDVVCGTDGNEWVEKYYSFIYQIETGTNTLTRTFQPCYKLDEKKEIKKLTVFPLLYSEKYDSALYFSPKICMTLINEYYKK